MSVLDKLAGALGRNDERPNVELAEALAAKGDSKAIEELVAALSAGPVAVQNDAIKVLYEIGALKPKLIAGHAEAFIALLGSKNNRNVWGTLQALESIASEAPTVLAKNLDAIVAAADKGSVIAKDKAVGILSRLALAGHAKAVPVLLERVRDAAPNQFPMYAELRCRRSGTRIARRSGASSRRGSRRFRSRRNGRGSRRCSGSSGHETKNGAPWGAPFQTRGDGPSARPSRPADPRACARRTRARPGSAR